MAKNIPIKPTPITSSDDYRTIQKLSSRMEQSSEDLEDWFEREEEYRREFGDLQSLKDEEDISGQ